MVLHAHLPFVRHPDHERWLEEDWLYEAIIETYLPLLRTFEGLVSHGVRFRLTLTMSPTLTAMLEDPVLQERFLGHLDRLIELAEKEVSRTRWMPEFCHLAERYLGIFRNSRDEFENKYGRRLVPAFARLEEAGVLEILTCGATHGFLPLMLDNANLWRGQIVTAAKDHERLFGRAPRGIWLPECGYTPGVESVLAEAGLEHFFLDSHGITHASPHPHYGVYAPVRTPSGPVAYARDPQSSRQVWSAEAGYPGDADYREFYRDVGFDLDYDYVRPYLHSDGNRTHLGIKYYRVTKRGDQKDPYDFDRAKERAARQAEDFIARRLSQVEELASRMDRPPVIVSPYDAELFGHWWFEGPQWLEYLFLKLHHDQSTIETITASDYEERIGNIQEAVPSMSSWGHNGYSEYWLDPKNDWIYPPLLRAGERMITLADRFYTLGSGLHHPQGDELAGRALAQAARELLLAQSSDWAFILRAGTMAEYAKWRVEGHIANFTRLADDLVQGSIDEEWLLGVERQNIIVPEVDFRVWANPVASGCEEGLASMGPADGQDASGGANPEESPGESAPESSQGRRAQSEASTLPSSSSPSS